GAVLVVLLAQPLLPVERPLHHGHVGHRLGAPEADRALLLLPLDAGDVRPGGVADLDRRARVGADELGEIGGGHSAPPHRRRRVRLVEPGEDPEQGALARAVLADYADPGTLAHLEVEPPEHGSTAVRLDGVAE